MIETCHIIKSPLSVISGAKNGKASSDSLCVHSTVIKCSIGEGGHRICVVVVEVGIVDECAYITQSDSFRARRHLRVRRKGWKLPSSPPPLPFQPPRARHPLRCPSAPVETLAQSVVCEPLRCADVCDGGGDSPSDDCGTRKGRKSAFGSGDDGGGTIINPRHFVG